MSEVLDVTKMLQFLYDSYEGDISIGFVHSTTGEEDETHEGELLIVTDANDVKNSPLSMMFKDVKLTNMEGLQVYPIDHEWTDVMYDIKLPYRIAFTTKDMIREENGIRTTYMGETEVVLEGTLAAKFMIMYLTEKLELDLDYIFPNGDGSKFVTPTSQDKLAVWYRQMMLAEGRELNGLSLVPCDKKGNAAQMGKNYGFRPVVEPECEMLNLPAEDFEKIVNNYINNPSSATRVISRTGNTEEALLNAFLTWRKAIYDNAGLSKAERKKVISQIPNYGCIRMLQREIDKNINRNIKNGE